MFLVLYTLGFEEEPNLRTSPTTKLDNGTSSEGVKRRWKVQLLRIGAALGASYFIVLGFFDYSMHQPPETFSRVMMHVGPVPFLLFPFETMWKSARAGHLLVGGTAPDFTLPLLDHSGSVRLSSFRGRQPVVLIFGSYT
jgi:hypothetical protein